MMIKLFSLFCLMALTQITFAQEFSKQDSIRLNAILDGDQELHINKDVINQIDFGAGVWGSQMMIMDKQWLSPDATLPSIHPDEIPLDKRQILSLKPYKANTPYNWDPVRQKKIKVTKDTWRSDPYREIKSRLIYSNWASKPHEAGMRNSVAAIEATGLRYNPFAGKVGGASVGAWQAVSTGSGTDLMAPFTKEFWNRAGRKRRMRTFEVLSQYGDSTTVTVNQALIQPSLH